MLLVTLFFFSLLAATTHAYGQGGNGRESTTPQPPKKITAKTASTKKTRSKPAKAPASTSSKESTDLTSGSDTNSRSPKPVRAVKAPEKVVVRTVTRVENATPTTGSLAVAAEPDTRLTLEPINITGAVEKKGVVPSGERVFIFNDLKPGEYRVVGTHAGYSPAEVKVLVEKNRNKAVTLNFQAVANEVTGAFEGQVFDELTNSPLAGATVRFINKDSGVQFAVKTDSQGRFRKGLLLPGDYTIRVSSQGYIEYETRLTLEITKRNSDFPVLIRLTPE